MSNFSLFPKDSEFLNFKNKRLDLYMPVVLGIYLIGAVFDFFNVFSFSNRLAFMLGSFSFLSVGYFIERKVSKK